MENILDFLKKLKESSLLIVALISAFLAVINWYLGIDKRIENIESNVAKLEIEYKNMYRNSLLRTKIRIEREIKELVDREKELTQIEREKLTELIIEREKIIIDLNQLLNERKQIK